MTKRRLLAAGAVVAVLTGAVVWAQAPGLPGGGHFGPFGPLLALHHAKQELGLTTDQEKQIKGILRSHREEFEGIVERLHAGHEAVRQAGDQATFDEAAIRDRVAEAVAPLGDLAVLHARVHREIGAVLTAEQRQKAEAFREKLRSHIREFHKSMHELADDLLEDHS